MRKVNQVVTAAIAALLLCGVPGAQAWTSKDTKAHSHAARTDKDKAMRITTAPRLSGVDAKVGERMLEAFGTKYLPRIYARYQELCEKAKKREAVLRRNFPDGRASDSSGGEFYDKITRLVSESVAEMDQCHDELCHYYLLHRAGVVTDAELSKIDLAKPPIVFSRVESPREVGNPQKPMEEVRAFAGKYLPTVLAGYDSLAHIFKDDAATYGVLVADARNMDAVHGGMVLKPLAERLIEIRSKLDELAGEMKKLKILYDMEATTAEQLAVKDRERGVEIQSFEKRLRRAPGEAAPQHADDRQRWRPRRRRFDGEVAPQPGGDPEDVEAVRRDFDHDGLPDAWERRYGLDPDNPADANQDADGDLFTNLEEFKAYTNPKDPEDHPDYLDDLAIAGDVKIEPLPFWLIGAVLGGLRMEFAVVDQQAYQGKTDARKGEEIQYKLKKWSKKGDRVPSGWVLKDITSENKKVKRPGSEQLYDKTVYTVVLERTSDKFQLSVKEGVHPIAVQEQIDLQWNRGEGKTFTVSEGSEFALANRTYRVKALKRGCVTILDLKTVKVRNIE